MLNMTALLERAVVAEIAIFHVEVSWREMNESKLALHVPSLFPQRGAEEVPAPDPARSTPSSTRNPGNDAIAFPHEPLRHDHQVSFPDVYYKHLLTVTGSFDSSGSDGTPLLCTRPAILLRPPFSSIANHSKTSGSEADSDDDSDTEDSEPEYNASDLTPLTQIRTDPRVGDARLQSHRLLITSMLDLTESFLKRHGYNLPRYDGSMRNHLREASPH